ncbi:MAG: hypothetical protein GXO09_02055 [Crenarchaeota archaeon]|nr:hypothetical protein [Thermoproteota archaeon]
MTMEEKAVVIPVTIGPGALEAAVSSITRIYEETGAKRFEVLYTTRAGPQTVRILTRIFHDTPLRIEPRLVPEEPGDAEREIRRLIEKLSREGTVQVYVVPTPGSRRLAAAVSMAGYREDACVLHIDFYWGPWTGLPFPLVPRVFEPLYILHCNHAPTPVSDREEARKVINKVAAAMMDRIHSKAALRRMVAEQVKNTNASQAVKPVVRRTYTGAEVETDCGGLRIEFRASLHGQGGEQVNIEAIVNNWCSEEEWVKAARKILDTVEASRGTRLGGLLTGLARLSGLYRIVFYDRDGMEKDMENIEDEVIIDTNLVYWGIHNDCTDSLRRLRPVIPYAVQAELYRRYAEALKNYPRNPASSLEDVAALYALEELRRTCKAPLIPSPSPPADTAIPSIDPILLESRYIATGDTGAFRLWCEHPAGRIAKPLYARMRRLTEMDTDDRRRLAASAAYAVYQLVALIRLLSKTSKEVYRGTGIGLHASITPTPL